MINESSGNSNYGWAAKSSGTPLLQRALDWDSFNLQIFSATTTFA
jgi:hypothetical protein